MPNWFFLRQTYWNEARRFGLVVADDVKTIYHYTSLHGLLGIFESQEIWLSDYSYLNDSRELSHGAELAVEAINDLLVDNDNGASIEVLAQWRDQLQRIPNRVCIASFSEDFDSLSQWRAYGSIAIGFDVRSLALHVNQGTLGRVEYDPTVQRKLLAIYLQHARSAAERDQELGQFENVRASYLRPEQLIEIIAFFKDQSFASEREVRLAYVDNPELYSQLGFKPLPKSFRVSGGRLLPYVSSKQVLKSEIRNFQLEFSEVVIGPGGDELLARGVREFLDAQGLGSIPIHRSKVPFRT